MATDFMPGIKNSWSLIGFAKAFGKKMETGISTNKETGEQFASCSFTDDNGARTFVSFSTKLGTLSASEIARMKDDLQVVQLNSDTYKLCKKGESTWDTVDLGL